MLPWLVGSVSFLVLAIVFGGMYLSHRDEVKQAEEEEEERRQMRLVDEVFARHHREKMEAIERKRERVAKLVELTWPELRALCEHIHGQPCECPTKEAVAGLIYAFEQKATRDEGLRANSDDLPTRPADRSSSSLGNL